MTTPVQEVAGGKFDRCINNFLGFGDETGEVTTSNVAANEQASSDVITTDFDWAIFDADIGELGEGDLSTVCIFDFQLCKFLNIGSPFRIESHLHGESSLPFEDLSDDFSADGLNRIEDISGVNAIASEGIASNDHSAVGESGDLLSGHIRGAIDAL